MNNPGKLARFHCILVVLFLNTKTVVSDTSLSSVSTAVMMSYLVPRHVCRSVRSSACRVYNVGVSWLYRLESW